MSFEQVADIPYDLCQFIIALKPSDELPNGYLGTWIGQILSRRPPALISAGVAKVLAVDFGLNDSPLSHCFNAM